MASHSETDDIEKRQKEGSRSSLEETLIEVWRQAFAENTKAVALETERYPVVPGAPSFAPREGWGF